MITVKLLNRTFHIDPLTVIVTPNAVYARIELPGREGSTFVHYVETDERLTGLCYDVPEAPKPLTVVLTPEMAKAVNASALVAIVVREHVSLFSEHMRAA